MELQTTSGQVDLTQKKNMAKFVHDVADMEVRYFSLNESAKVTKKKALEQMEQAKRKFNQTQACVGGWVSRKQQAQTAVEEIRTYRQWRKKTASAGRFFAEFFTFFFVYGIVAGVSSPLLSGLFEWLIFGTPFDNFKGVFVVPLLLVWLVVYWAIFRAVRKSEYKEELNKWESEFASANQQYEKAKNDAELADNDYREAEKNFPHIMERVQELENSASSIQKDIQACYSLDVIKPAYRNLVSVVILDEIFQNDKCDTMREANLLCDTEIRHAELIGKLDQVLHALEALAISLQHINRVMNSINENVSMISQDVYRIAEGQERIAYATESLQKSADNVDFYVAQKRAGSL